VSSVALRGLTKRFGSLTVLDNVSLTVEHGKLVCLLGPSGCGKTTALRLIAGFIEPSGGEIALGERIVSSPSRVLPLCKPAIGAAGLFLFIHAWNEFVAGSVMVDAKELKPIQPLLYQYIGFFGREWGPLTAAATIAVIPIFVIYALFGRLLISGLTRGATKELS